MTTLYERIRQLRISAGMSQDDLAHAMGYSDRSMITKIESGKVDISQKKILAFARVLNTTPAYLMGWKDDPQNPQVFTGSSSEEKLVAAYRSLTPRGQELLLDRAEELKFLHGKKSEDHSAQSVQEGVK